LLILPYAKNSDVSQSIKWLINQSIFFSRSVNKRGPAGMSRVEAEGAAESGKVIFFGQSPNLSGTNQRVKMKKNNIFFYLLNEKWMHSVQRDEVLEMRVLLRPTYYWVG